jgi:hypothetical protein
MTLAAVDRLVLHATIFEITSTATGAGRPANYATIKDTGDLSLRDNQIQT